MVAAVKVRPSALFSAQKRRASKSKKSVISVAKAVVSVMRRELGEDAVARWRSLLDTELGESFFESLEDGKGATKPIRKPAAHMTHRQLGHLTSQRRCCCCSTRSDAPMS